MKRIFGVKFIILISFLLAGCSMLFPSLKSSYKKNKLDSFVVEHKDMYNSEFRENPTIGYYSYNGYSWIYFTIFKNKHLTLYDNNIYFGPIMNDRSQYTYFHKRKNSLSVASYNVGPYGFVYLKLQKLTPYKSKITYYFGKNSLFIRKYILLNDKDVFPIDEQIKLVQYLFYSGDKQIVKNKLFKLYLEYSKINSDFLRLKRFYNKVKKTSYTNFIKFVDEKIVAYKKKIENEYKNSNTYTKLLAFSKKYPFYKRKEVRAKLIDLYIKENSNNPYKFAKVFVMFPETKKDTNIYNKYILLKVDNTNSIEGLQKILENCKTGYCKSLCKQKIKNLKHANVMEELKRTIFYYKFDNLTWYGSIDEQGWPIGTGKFIAKKTLGDGFLSSYFAKIVIRVTFKNHCIDSSTDNYVSSRVFKGGLIFTTPVSKTYTKKFYDVLSMNDAIVDTINMGIRKFNASMKKSTPNCEKMFSDCMKACNYKSTKGFFDDKSSCQTYCFMAKDKCKKGRYDLARRNYCSAVCLGAEKYNGGLFGSSNYDKCVDNCLK